MAIRGNIQAIVQSSVKNASGNSGQVVLNAGMGGGDIDAAHFFLNVSASNTPTTLDVYVQHSPNLGANYYDFGHFLQVGAVSTSIQSLVWQRWPSTLNTTGTGVTVTGDAALAAGVVINGPILTNFFRVKWVIVGTSYTFQLFGIFDVGEQ